MFTTVKRHGWLTSTLRFVPVIAIAAAAMIAMAPTDARAQAFSVVDFSCADTQPAVDIDIRGLGHTDICVISTIEVDVDCACVGGGNNCPTDAKKQTTPTTSAVPSILEPKNGRVFTTLTAPFTAPTTCSGPTCGSGQTAKVIEFSASASFRVCPLPSAGCSPDTCSTTAGQTLATAGVCGPSTVVVNPGKHNSCVDLFLP